MGLPCSSVGTQYGSSEVANGLVLEVLPLRSTVLNPGMKPTSLGSPGPRLLAPDAMQLGVFGGHVAPVGSYPLAPDAEGRGWKYRGAGSPFLSRKFCPMREEPTTLPWCVTNDPS